MRDPEETLEELTKILDDLSSRDEDVVILVEGQKDRAALSVLGVGGEVWQVQGPNPLLATAERLAHEGKEAIILTDWDRKGGQLAHSLRLGLSACGVQYDDSTRIRLVKLVKTEIKDMESLPAFYTRLVSLEQKAKLERQTARTNASIARIKSAENKARARPPS
ncbi:MAG: toprim domain-containing protein [Methanomassiliicoccales archaeon]